MKRGRDVLVLISIIVIIGIVYLIDSYDTGEAGQKAEMKEKSASSQTLQVSVKNYGAVGDGKTDETFAFQAAIDDIGDKGGGDVWIPVGTYLLHPIFLKPNVNLIGENRDTVILKLSDEAKDDYTRLITMENNTKVQSLTCDGNYQNHPNGIEHMHCIFVYDHTNVVIDNNKIINAVGDGISVSGSNVTSQFVTISNNLLMENQRSQIVIEQVNHIKIVNNEITSKTGRPAIHFEPWEERQYEDAEISGNSITSNANGYCVLLAGADSGATKEDKKGLFFHGIKFYQNSVTCSSGSFLLMDTSGAEVFDNTLNIKEIHVWRKNEDITIYKNKIHATIGIRIEGGKEGKLTSERTKIYDNSIHSIQDGVNIHAGAKNTQIDNNRFIGSKKASGVALFASEDIENTVVTLNTFQNYDEGIFLDYDYYSKTLIDGVKVMRNTFTDMNGFAFNIKGEVKNVFFEKNEVNHSKGVYILIENRSMKNISIKKNKLVDGDKGVIIEPPKSRLLNDLSISENQLSD